MTEEWRTVPGFEGRYEASDLGRVRSVSRLIMGGNGLRMHKGKVLKPIPSKFGYPRVFLCLGAKGKYLRTTVHAVVAKAFLGMPPVGHQVAHKDGTRTNARPENLTYKTAKGNAEDREAHGRTARGESGGNSKLKTEEARAILALTGKEARVITAQRFGCSRTNVYDIQTRKSWAHL